MILLTLMIALFLYCLCRVSAEPDEERPIQPPRVGAERMRQMGLIDNDN